MSEMVERAAAAVEEQMASDDNHPTDIVRAVMRAMREPTEGMVAAATWPIVYDSSGAGTNRSPRQAWELMIDEALK